MNEAQGAEVCRPHHKLALENIKKEFTERSNLIKKKNPIWVLKLTFFSQDQMMKDEYWFSVFCLFLLTWKTHLLANINIFDQNLKRFFILWFNLISLILISEWKNNFGLAVWTEKSKSNVILAFNQFHFHLFQRDRPTKRFEMFFYWQLKRRQILRK